MQHGLVEGNVGVSEGGASPPTPSPRQRTIPIGANPTWWLQQFKATTLSYFAVAVIDSMSIVDSVLSFAPALLGVFVSFKFSQHQVHVRDDGVTSSVEKTEVCRDGGVIWLDVQRSNCNQNVTLANVAQCSFLPALPRRKTCKFRRAWHDALERLFRDLASHHLPDPKIDGFWRAMLQWRAPLVVSACTYVPVVA